MGGTLKVRLGGGVGFPGNDLRASESRFVLKHLFLLDNIGNHSGYRRTQPRMVIREPWVRVGKS